MFEYVKSLQIKKALDQHHIRTGKTLEYGCGSAGISIWLANQGFDVYASDINRSALEVARINAQLHDSPNLHYVVANTLNMPFDDNTFDVVSSWGLLEHFGDEALTQLLTEVIRVLKPNGLFLADIVPGPERFSIRTLGLAANFSGSALAHLARGKAGKIPEVFKNYFDFAYESAFSSSEWVGILKDSKLRDVAIKVCRPFPPLALSGKLEQSYVSLMKRSLELWQKFDESDLWLTRRLGWMYFVTAIK
jgi:ubiquinone/menaquinone biosynthesis C-methylase UbiE